MTDYLYGPIYFDAALGLALTSTTLQGIRKGFASFKAALFDETQLSQRYALAGEGTLYLGLSSLSFYALTYYWMDRFETGFKYSSEENRKEFQDQTSLLERKIKQQFQVLDPLINQRIEVGHKLKEDAAHRISRTQQSFQTEKAKYTLNLQAYEIETHKIAELVDIVKQLFNTAVQGRYYPVRNWASLCSQGAGDPPCKRKEFSYLSKVLKDYHSLREEERGLYSSELPQKRELSHKIFPCTQEEWEERGRCMLRIFQISFEKIKECPLEKPDANKAKALLGLSHQNPSQKEIKKQYHKLSVLYHPDKQDQYTCLSQECRESKNAFLACLFRMISKAYENLK